jgi:hypothetical protein
VVAAAIAFAAPAFAVPIELQFNVVGLGAFTANTPSVTTATTISTGTPNLVAFIQQNNVSLTAGQATTLLPDPLPVALGGQFTKSFTTELGTFVETLTVTQVQAGTNALSVLATGTIVQTVGTGFDPVPVFWSAAYTQNSGPGTQINGSFNNSTTPLTRSPNPLRLPSLVLVWPALAGLAAAADVFACGAQRRAPLTMTSSAAACLACLWQVWVA